MGVYIKGELPTKFNGITMAEAVSLADEYLEREPCDRMWDAVRALRDFCECVTDEAIKVKTPHGRLGDLDKALGECFAVEDIALEPTVIEAEVE